EVEAVAAVDDRGQDLLGLRGGQDEDRVRGRLLERLEERVPGLRREHVRLVEDVDLRPAADRRVGDALAQLADVVNRVVGGRVHLDDVQRRRRGDRAAGRADPAGLGRRALGAVQARGEDLRHRRLAGAPAAHEEVGVVDLALLHRVAQRPHDVLLADDVGERARSVSAVERGAGGHGRPSLALRPAGPARPRRPRAESRAMPAALLDELFDWLRIPSISTGGGDARELERAASWVVDRVVAAGGEGRLERGGDGHPLAVGELRAARADAPTVLLYGHYDVQSPGPPEAWRTPPFEPVVADGRVHARGASDDKGNVLPLLHLACALGRAGELPVHVRVLVEGEEEIGSPSVSRWVIADERGADAAIVFDAAMVDADTPAITIGLRGLVQAN